MNLKKSSNPGGLHLCKDAPLFLVIIIAFGLFKTELSVAKASKRASVSSVVPIKVTQSNDLAATAFSGASEQWEYTGPEASCQISWLLMITKGKNLGAIQDLSLCTKKITNRFEVYDSMLSDIHTRFPKLKIQAFSSGAYHGDTEYRQRMAVASMDSPKWKSYLEGKNPTHINEIFVSVFNENTIASELVRAFKNRSLHIVLKTVEKVFTAERALDLEYAKEFPALKASKLKVLEAAGFMSFSVSLIQL